VIEELITARLLRRSGSARRQQLVAFRGDDGDLASGYWAAWSRLSPAPWRDAPRIAERLLSLDRDAPADGSRTWAAHIVERTLPAFVTVADLGGPSYEAARGTTLQVHDAARGHARRASAWLAARLRYGIG
jgi:hypothetical protein